MNAMTENTTKTECQTKTGCCKGTTECGCFRFCNFIIGILFIAAAMTAFRNPLGNLFAIAIVFGILAILSGLWSIAHGFGSKIRFFIGIIEIVIGILLLSNLYITAATIPFVFAIWFVFNSVSNLTLLPQVRPLGRGHYWFVLLMGLLGIGIGVAMFFKPVLAVLTLSFVVGFYLMIVGIEHIILAFSRPKHQMPMDSQEK